MLNLIRSSCHFSVWGLLALLLSLALPCNAIAQSKPLKHIYIGVSSVSMGNIIIYVAKEAKLYEKYGLYADPVAMRGSGESSKAMIGGSIQFSPVATPTVINAGLSGADLVILGHTLPGVVHAMVVKPEIKRVEDLKGKKIGVTTFGSLTDFLVQFHLRKKGLNPQRDVALIQIGGDSERIGALKQGSIDAASLSFPGYGIAMKMGFPMLWNSAKEIDYPWIEITTRRSIIQKDREMVMNYMKAHLEATALFKKDREFGKKVIKKTLRLDNEELVNESYDLFAKAFLPAPYPNTAGMRTSFEYVAATRPDVMDHKPEEYVDRSFIEELDKSGFIKKLYEK
ncbi:MAG TPA: ABC transporter substrate-binding protein [Candidatus Saccharimonadales bacterium]|nr:ABC transporter substrate-binding protein [Candidatus Saccharimonadales bacterium]